MHVVDDVDDLLLGGKKIQDNILLHYLQEVYCHVVFLSVCIVTILLEQGLEIVNVLVCETNCSCGKEPKLNNHRIRLLAKLEVKYGDAHLQDDRGCGLQGEKVLKHVKYGLIDEFRVKLQEMLNV